MKNDASLRSVFRQTFSSFRKDKATRSAAALAYYTIFSIVPMLLIVIAAAGLVLGKRAAQTEILGQLAGVLGSATADAIQEMLKSAAETKAGVIASLVGTVTFFFGAAGVFAELRAALNTIWNVKPRKAEGTIDFVSKYLPSLLMVFGVGSLMMVSLVFDSGITTMGSYAGHHLLGGEWLWKSLQLVISTVVATVLFALIFRFLPEANVKWRDVTIGAAVTAFLFVLGKFTLGLYLREASVGSGFGAAGSIIVVLVWVYWSALIFLFGMEFTHVYAMADRTAVELVEPMPEPARAARQISPA